MLHRLILKVTKFQAPPPKRLGTVGKSILGAIVPPMSNRVKLAFSPSTVVGRGWHNESGGVKYKSRVTFLSMSCQPINFDKELAFVSYSNPLGI